MDSRQDQLEDARPVKGGAARQDIGRDPRVTAAGQLLMNLLQALTVLALGFVANNLWQINLTLAADAVTKQETARQLADARAQIEKNDARDERQEDHINAVDRRVYTLEGRNLRGPPEPVNGR